jgi:hypothetical protein
MADDNNDTPPDDPAAVAGGVREVRETTQPLFETMIEQGERTASLSDGMVGVSQATIGERVARWSSIQR